MTAVFAQMCRDAVGAGFDREQRRLHRIGMLPAARVADRRDVIDVDAEAENGRGHAGQRIQFSTFNPTMRLNSRSLPVTKVSPRSRACAAIQRSLLPIICPLVARSQRSKP